MDSLGRNYCLLSVLVLFGTLCSVASSENGTDGETIDSEGLIQLGRKLRKPMLTLIDMAIRNLHECSQWSAWSSSDAIRPGYFGSKERTRTCYHELTEVNDTISTTDTTDFDYEICEGSCRSDYNVTWQGACIKFNTETKSYGDAENACKSDGGSLIRIDTLAKYTSVKAMLAGYGSRVYITGRRQHIGADWDFLPDMVQWYSGEPSNSSTELCLYLHERDRRWADIECSNNYASLCEIQN